MFLGFNLESETTSNQATQKAFAPPILRRAIILAFALMITGGTAPFAVAQKVQLSVDVSQVGAKIDRNLFGQFAEHLGHGVYDGIWVGPDSSIPNTRGIRNDVVAALKALNVPNVRWPSASDNTQPQLGWRY